MRGYVTYLVYSTSTTSRTQLFHIVARVLIHLAPGRQLNLRRAERRRVASFRKWRCAAGRERTVTADRLSCCNLTKWDVELRLERHRAPVRTGGPECRQLVRSVGARASIPQTPATRHGVVLTERSAHGNGAETHATTTSIPDIPDCARLSPDRW